jgi:hypothetical protein
MKAKQVLRHHMADPVRMRGFAELANRMAGEGVNESIGYGI